MSDMYYQCEMAQDTTRTRAYIEAKGAKLGNRITIEEDGFEGYWTVVSVADKGITKETLRDKQSMDRNAFGSIAGQTKR